MKRPIIPPPLLGLILAGAMWAIARWSGIAVLDFPGRVVLAAIFAGAGLAIDAVSVAAFVRAKTTVNPMAPERSNALVISGLYRISRNPMYLGMAMILVGIALYLGAPLALLMALLFVFLIERWQIAPEERALEEKFGDQYRAYKKRVRRWI